MGRLSLGCAHSAHRQGISAALGTFTSLTHFQSKKGKRRSLYASSWLFLPFWFGVHLRLSLGSHGLLISQIEALFNSDSRFFPLSFSFSNFKENYGECSSVFSSCRFCHFMLLTASYPICLDLSKLEFRVASDNLKGS